MNWKGQRVLLIGGLSGAAFHVMKDGADLVELMPASPGVGEHPALAVASWVKGHPGYDAKLQIRGCAGTTLTDRGEWDVIVLDRIGEHELPAVVSRAQLALAEGGRIIGGRHFLDTEQAVGPPLEPIPFKEGPHTNTVLHVHNVRRCGGTGNFVYDMARCFPEFQHVALCVNDPRGDPQWINDVSETMRTMYAPQLTKEIMDDIDPRVVVLHSTVGTKVKGEWPWAWLSDGGRRYVIALHHTATYPLFPADLDVFVSEYIKGRYEKFLGRMKDHMVLPPCTDMAPYAAIPRNGVRNRLVTTGGKACAELQAFMQEDFGWEWDSSPPGRLGQFAGYLGKFGFAVIWSGHQETWCRTVSEALAAGCVTVAHRAGAIPEQITPGENGYLFQDRASLVDVMEELGALSDDRLAEIAQAGREWAVKHVGFDRMRQGLYPRLIKATLGS